MVLGVIHLLEQEEESLVVKVEDVVVVEDQEVAQHLEELVQVAVVEDLVGIQEVVAAAMDHQPGAANFPSNHKTRNRKHFSPLWDT